MKLTDEQAKEVVFLALPVWRGMLWDLCLCLLDGRDRLSHRSNEQEVHDICLCARRESE
jgi:hypothetical protein